ncbi:hypothetical protein KOR42_49460 [Thalassoglobus neptunius]|uniref:Uncharacterized protein n=1 Tax=Thalassoglobus neptunius TaxID=1938619 RepID=A0A5C5VNN3_9PLAN|nr:hypothetical protein [Thalassoglobus neptunius]TWT40204.1 hypothetical protein KOR42_49460 [Thalassoglobus neptunius]
MIKVKRKVQIRDNRRGRRRQDSRDQPDVPSGRIPRISRLMALAIKFDGLITTGIITDRSELARLAHVTQPRMTQIMNLLNLAPDIQEELLFLPRVTSGRDPVHERMLRPLTAQASWKKQRKMWLGIMTNCQIAHRR